MGVKLNEKTKKWEVSVSGRHPITKKPQSLRRIGIKSKAEAKRVEKLLAIKLHEKFHEAICPSWKESVLRFKKSSLERGLRERTIENYVLCLEKHTFPIWADRTVDSIKTGDITDLIKVKLSEKSPSHQKNMLKYINGVMNFALEQGFINRNPCPRLKFRIGDKHKGVLTMEQARIFLDKANEIDHEYYPHWMMALYTGMRNGELYALTWDKVDLKNRKILVSSGWTKKDGYKDYTKSGDDRLVEIAEDLIPLLIQLKTTSDESTFVLPRIDTWDKGDQARELRKFLHVLGLPQIRFHDLRASWCTMMLSLGIEPVKVMKMGGWKDLKTIQIYFRQAGVDIKGITEKLKIHNPAKQIGEVLEFKKFT